MHKGLLIGIVKSVDDPAGWGRVQLTLPTLGGISSGWAPVVHLLAGKDRGAWFAPEVEDEALVGFLNDDFNHPYVLGYLWNGTDTPPETEVQSRVLKTPGGHQLRFEDKDGAKKVVLTTAGGLAITLDDNQKSIEIKGGGRAITLQSGQLRIT